MGAGAKWSREQYAKAVAAENDPSKNYPASFVQQLGESIHEAEQAHPEWIASGDSGSPVNGLPRNGADEHPPNPEAPVEATPPATPDIPTQAPPPEQDMWDALASAHIPGPDPMASRANQWASGVRDQFADPTAAPRSAGAGAVYGAGANAAAVGADLAGRFGPQDPAGYTREYTRSGVAPRVVGGMAVGPGSEQADIERSWRQGDQAAQALRPGAALAGSLAVPIATMGIVPPAASLGGRVAAGATTAAIPGAVHGAATSQSPTLGGMAVDAGREAWRNAKIGGGLTLGTAALAAGADKLEPLLKDWGQYSRGVAGGATRTGATLKTLEDNPYIQSPNDLGAAIEDQGLTMSRPGMSKYLPMSAHDYGKAASLADEAQGEIIGGTTDLASKRFAGIPRAELEDSIRGKITASMSNRTVQGKQITSALEDQLAELSSKPEFLTPNDLQQLKVQAGDVASKSSGGLTSLADEGTKGAYNDLRSTYRTKLIDSMGSKTQFDAAGRPLRLAPHESAGIDENYSQFRNALEDSSQLKTIEDTSSAYGRQQAARGLGAHLARDLPAAGLGASVGYRERSDSPESGALEGGLAGVLAMEAGQHYGPDIAATGLGNASRVAGAVGQGLGAVTPQAIGAATAAVPPDWWDAFFETDEQARNRAAH